MGRLLRVLTKLLLVIIVLMVAILAAFRVTAHLRETADPRDAAGQAGRFVEVDGLDIHYRQWGADNGPPVVLVHGTLAWAETWRDIAAPLGEAGYRVIALDLPPFGYSARPGGGDYSRGALARLISGFADTLELERFVLVGHSFGGGATMEAAMRMPDRTDALVLLDVALGLGRPESKGSALRTSLGFGPFRNALAATTFANPLVIPMGLRSFVHNNSVVTADRVALYRAPLATDGTTEAIGDWLLTGLFGVETGSMSSATDNYRDFNRPVLVIWGRRDTVTPLAQGEEIAALLPNARLVVLENVNHIPHLEAAGEVLRAMTAFLSKPFRDPVASPGKQDRLDLRPPVTP